MNLKIRLLIVMLSVALLSPSALSAQGQINLSKSRSMSELPFIVALPNGSLMAAWTDGGHFNGGGSVHYATWTSNSGWSTMRQVAEPTSAFPQLAVDGSGNVHMAYWEGSSSYSRDIYYRRYSGGSWSNKELIYDSWTVNSSWQRLNISGNRLYVLWCHNYMKPTPMDVVLIEKNIGGTWPSSYTNVSRATTSTSIHPFLKVKNGDVHAVWQEDKHQATNWNIYYASRINGYWSSPQRVYPGGNQYQCALEVDNQNGVHLIYSGRGGPIYYQKKSGSSWTAPKVISTAGTDITTFNYMTYANGMLHAVWRQREGEGQYIHYCQGSISGSWGIPIKVSHAGAGEYPGLAVDTQGRAHVVYSDIGVGGERDIFYVRVDQVTSYPSAIITAAPTQGDPPLYVSFDASESYDPDGRIVSYQWKFGDGAGAEGTKATHTYTKKGVYTATLTVRDDEENESSATQAITVGTPPVAVLAASPTSGGSPLTVSFDASESYDTDGNIVSYKWDFGDNTTGTGQLAQHTYNGFATRIATLVVKDNEGFEDSASVEIEVTNDPIAKIKYSPKKGEPPLKVSFDASNSKPADRNNGKITAYDWDFGDGSNGSGRTPVHNYTKPGHFTVTLRITDDQNIQDSSTVEVEAYSKPVARFTRSPLEGIAPCPVHFDGSGSSDEDGKIMVYKWVFGDGTTAYGKVVNHTYTKGGTFTIWLSVTDDDGWQSATSKQVTIIEKPYPPSSFTVQNIVNKSLYFTDCLNVLTWNKNAKNTGKIQVVKYMIFRRRKGASPNFIYIGEVDPGTFRFEDHNVSDESDVQSYIYGIRAVDAYGRESDLKKIDASTG